MNKLMLLAMMVGFMPLHSAVYGQTAAGNEPTGITFLHLRATATGFELIDAKTVKGVLHARRYSPEQTGLHVELRAADEQVLYRNAYPEPFVTRLEYEDPNQPGRIVAKPIDPPISEFTIRVPSFPSAKLIRFYRPLPATGQTSESRGKRQPALVYLGQVALPVNEQPR